MHDFRHAIRALRTAPIVSAVAIVSLTLGIGAKHRSLLGFTFSGDALSGSYRSAFHMPAVNGVVPAMVVHDDGNDHRVVDMVDD